MPDLPESFPEIEVSGLEDGPIDREAAVDGNEPVVRYCSRADLIGEPGKLFGQFGTNLVLLSDKVPEWGVLEENHDEDGNLHLGGLSIDVVGLLDSAIEDADVDEFAAEIADRTELDEERARLLVLSDGYELDAAGIAARLDTGEATVREQLAEIHEHHDRDEIAEQMGMPDIDFPIGYVRYGSTADAIGRPGQLFARLDDEFILLPKRVLGWDVLEKTDGSGEFHFADVPEDKLPMFDSKIEYVDIDGLAQSLVEGSDLDVLGAKVLLLFEGYELDPPEVAAELDVEESVVVERIEAIYDQYDEDEIVAAVQEHHPDVSAGTVRVFVLAEGFGWPADEIAEDLGVDEQTVRDRLVTARTEHGELEETLQEVI